MSVENMFYDYNLICKMKSDIKYKIRMMTTIFTSHPEMWRVTGITEKALQKFKDNDFKYKPGLQIHRSHLFNRNEIYAEMLGMKFKNCDVWWDYCGSGYGYCHPDHSIIRYITCVYLKDTQ